MRGVWGDAAPGVVPVGRPQPPGPVKAFSPLALFLTFWTGQLIYPARPCPWGTGGLQSALSFLPEVKDSLFTRVNHATISFALPCRCPFRMQFDVSEA